MQRERLAIERLQRDAAEHPHLEVRKIARLDPSILLDRLQAAGFALRNPDNHQGD